MSSLPHRFQFNIFETLFEFVSGEPLGKKLVVYGPNRSECDRHRHGMAWLMAIDAAESRPHAMESEK